MDLIKIVTGKVTEFSRFHIPSWPKSFIAPHEVRFDAHPFAGGSHGSVHRGMWVGTEIVVKLVRDDQESRALFHQ